jgi:hypothetical protein
MPANNVAVRRTSSQYAPPTVILQPSHAPWPAWIALRHDASALRLRAFSATPMGPWELDDRPAKLRRWMVNPLL